MNLRTKKIYSFSQIDIVPEALIVLDIDETLLTFGPYCINYVKLDSDNLDKFISDCKKALCEIIFLTARCESTRYETINDLHNIGIKCKTENVYFSNKKGDKLINIVKEKYKDFKHIIFVDDLIVNLLEVEFAFTPHEYNLDLYLIDHDFI